MILNNQPILASFNGAMPCCFSCAYRKFWMPTKQPVQWKVFNSAVCVSGVFSGLGASNTFTALHTFSMSGLPERLPERFSAMATSTHVSGLVGGLGLMGVVLCFVITTAKALILCFPV